jgi:lipopolysaccharide biosynthesis regulator YciM
VAAPGNTAYVHAIQKARDTGSSDARGAFADAARSSSYFRPDLSFANAVVLWKQHPSDTSLLYLLTVLSGEGSMKAVERCNANYPESPYLKQLTAEVLAEQGREDEAVTMYQQLIQTHPEISGLRYNLGMLYRKRGEWDKALKIFQEQLAVDPTKEQTASRVSEALIELNRWQEARSFLQSRTSSNDPPLWAAMDLSLAMQNLGDNAQAIRVLASAEKDNMPDAALHHRLMRLYITTNNRALAEKEKNLLAQILKDRELRYRQQMNGTATPTPEPTSDSAGH